MESTSTDPEGPRHRCPVCGNLVRASPSFAGDALCPRCGSLMWPPQPPLRSAHVRRQLEALGAVIRFDSDFETWEVDLRGAPVVREDLALLGDMRPVTELLLNGTPVDDGMARPIARLRELEVLDLAQTRLTDRGFAVLGPLERLEVLSLAETAVTDAGVRLLTEHVGLWSLDLSGTAIRGFGLEAFRRSTLEDLVLDDTLIDDSVVDLLASFQCLETLSVQRTRLTRDGVNRLREMLLGCKIDD